MSHNSKYYTKKLKKIDSSGSKSLSAFGFIPKRTSSLDTSESVCQSSVLDTSESVCHPSIGLEPCSENEIVSDSQPLQVEIQASEKVSDSQPLQVEIQASENVNEKPSAHFHFNEQSDGQASQDLHQTIMETDELPAGDDNMFVAVKIEKSDYSTVEHSTLFPLTKKQMTIDSKYESNYEWLYFSCSKNGYVCKFCELFGKSIVTRGVTSPFLSGTILGDHPVRKLDSHEQSDLHKESLKKYMRAKEGISDLTLPKMLENKMRKGTSEAEITRNRKYMACLISTTNLIVHKHWSLDSASDLIDHMAAANCPDITDYKKVNVLNYTSSTSITDVLSALSVYFENELLNKIRASAFITVLADESTDEANRNQFAILIRFMDNGKIDDHFVGVVNVKKADAATLTEAISSFLQSKEIDIGKVMFVGFDGCNTMSGEQNGVQRRFKNLVPHSQYINCRSHKLALCVKHLMNHFKVLEEVDFALLAVYKMFEYSPQKFAVFKEVQSSYAVRELVMVRAAATRWLSHGVACRRFIDRYVQIVDTLDELIDRKGEAEVIGLRDRITRKSTVAAILVLCDMLQPVNIFCKYLQGSCLDFSEVTSKLKELTDNLELLTDRFRASLNAHQDGLYISQMATLFQEIDDRTVFTRRLRERDVYTPAQLVEELAVPMIHKLLEELDYGFNFMSAELKAFSVFSMKYLPTTIEELGDYGKAKIEILTSYYGHQQEDTYKGHRSQSPPLFNNATAKAEFEGFKFTMFMSRNRDPAVDMLQKMLEDEHLRATYPSMFKLLLLSRLIPTSTASVERVFSLMNSLCTTNRNRLSQATLSSLMMLCREGQKTLRDEQITDIIDIFKRMKQRDIVL